MSGLSNTSSNKPLQIKLVKRKDGDKTYMHRVITAAYGSTYKENFQTNGGQRKQIKTILLLFSKQRY